MTRRYKAGSSLPVKKFKKGPRVGVPGCEHPNLGKQKYDYEGKAPSGDLVTKGGFFFDPPPDIAKMYIFLKPNGKWEARAVRLTEDWGVTERSRWINAVRIP